MSKNFDTRLQDLKQRRGPKIFAKAALAADALFADTIQESYETRSTGKATKYALGAMQQVDPLYTQDSFAEGERVKNQLKIGLQHEVSVEFEFQGSVPLNVHIRGVSDVDVLVLRSDVKTIDSKGPKGLLGNYSKWNGEPIAELLSQLRSKCISILRNSYPDSNVDISGSKSIAIDGFPLKRKVDVVPSHWHDSAAYQVSEKKKDRGVCILDTTVSKTFENYPFLHMACIEEKDFSTMGGAKKAIRLLKTLKADSDHCEDITLNSYDIASLVWHFKTSKLCVYQWTELSLIANLQEEIGAQIRNPNALKQLRTPDNTRCIIDSDKKFVSLCLLYAELKILADAVAKELTGTEVFTNTEAVGNALKQAVIL